MRFPSVCLLRDGCGDGGICVSSSDAQCLFAFRWLQRWRNMPFSARFPNVFHLRVDCGDDGICVSSVDAQCVFGIPMVVEMAESAF